MRYTPSFFLRYLFECPCQRVRRLLSRYHGRISASTTPTNGTPGMALKTSTMVASKVFGKDGTPGEAIVTTFLLDWPHTAHVEKG